MNRVKQTIFHTLVCKIHIINKSTLPLEGKSHFLKKKRNQNRIHGKSGVQGSGIPLVQLHRKVKHCCNSQALLSLLPLLSLDMCLLAARDTLWLFKERERGKGREWGSFIETPGHATRVRSLPPCVSPDPPPPPPLFSFLLFCSFASTLPHRDVCIPPYITLSSESLPQSPMSPPSPSLSLSLLQL